MAGGLVWRSAQSIVTPYVIEVDQSGQVRAVGEAATPYRPADGADRAPPGALRDAGALAVYRSHRGAAKLAGRLRLHHRQRRGGAQRLRQQERSFRPCWPRVGDARITSVVRASDASFNVRWTEQRFINGAPAGTERWNAVLSTVLQTPRTEQRLRKNPLGIYVNGLSWSRELDSSEGAKP